MSSTPDIKISEPFVAIILINSLPSDYTPLVQSLLTNFESLTLPRLYSLLNIEATRSMNGSKTDTALSANRFNGGKKSKKKESYQSNKDTIYCSLGHAGHTDEQCKTKKWREFKDYQESMKEKSSSGGEKMQEAAQMTQTEHVNQIDLDKADVSYYDTAFTAHESHLPTIIDTGVSSHMYGDKKVFKSLFKTEPSQIAVTSKGGEIWSTEKGSVSIGTLTL